MANHSVGARDELLESEAVLASVFCCFLSSETKRYCCQTETMSSSETKISVSMLELSVIKITTMAT